MQSDALVGSGDPYRTRERDDAREQLLVLVIVNQSSVGGETFGGKVAAPAAASILKQSLVYLRISPDEHLLKAASNWRDDDVE